MKKILVVFIVITQIMAFGIGYYIGVNKGDKKVVDKSEQATDNIYAEEKNVKENDNNVEDILKSMTIEEMVYQMLFVTPESIIPEKYDIDTVIQAGDATNEALQEKPVGGIIYFEQNLINREQTIKMLENTQRFSKIPVFTGVDEEGGIVMRLGDNPDMGATEHPPMAEVADAKQAKKIGKILEADLSYFGFNVDFAPVADVNVTEGNMIGNRSFGSDANRVSEMVESLVSGLQGSGKVSATLKHFPGHGSSTGDTHHGSSESERTIEQLRECEFLPFKAGIEAGVDFVMISHVIYKNATTENIPATLSKEVVTDMLRDELKFKGIIISDAFNMEAIVDSQGVSAVKAVKAGVDMILMPKNPLEVHSAIVSAVESGEIPEERIKESVRRILTLKHKKGLI